MRIEQGRYTKEKLEERVCLLCNNGRVEDEKHFMLDCVTYEDLRTKMWSSVEEITGESKESIPEEDRLNALIGDKYQSDSSEKDENYEQIARAVMKFITAAMNRRRKVLDGVMSTRV